MNHRHFKLPPTGIGHNHKQYHCGVNLEKLERDPDIKVREELQGIQPVTQRTRERNTNIGNDTVITVLIRKPRTQECPTRM